MWKPSSLILARADAYCARHGISRYDKTLGGGKDGGVWPTSRVTALKIHDRVESYRTERNAYTRFRDVGLRSVAGHQIPLLKAFDDDLWAIEMTIVWPPFVVDFASACFDVDPELIEDEGHTLEDMVRERFGDERVAEVLGIREELIARAGVYLSDLHGHNIKFGA